MYRFKFADIGEGIHEGKILEWKYKVGDQAEEGETLVVVETDKVNAEIPLPVDGKIVEIGPDVGETIEVGDLLAAIDDGEGDNDEDTKSDKKQDTSEETSSKTEPVSEDDDAGVVGALESSDEVIESSSETKRSSSNGSKVMATPVARKYAADHDINIQKVQGSGEHGRVLREDIEKIINQSSSAKKSSGQSLNTVNLPEIKAYDTDRREKITTLRRSVVHAMTLSKQVIPHTTLMDELDVTGLVEFRNAHKSKAADENVKLTYMAFIIKALTNTIKEYPILNSSYDQANEEIIYRGDMNVGI
ncbi:MAG TPA: dihydrolipoamide acetyltransferase family protein, partial [Candidatus Izemoplasmatales bacterium]|nr:dihydrolipoamide acetyltransferase family protein [Candidatus Izemoplasmatales bacterium]